MKIIDESQAKALVRGLKRKYAGRSDRKATPPNIPFQAKKRGRLLAEHIEKIQRMFGLT